jgi:prevent-host-death family protein
MVVNIHEAKTNFSRLVDKALQGEEVIIARSGKPLLQLCPIKGLATEKEPGLSVGTISISEDFDAPLPAEILAEFE